MTTPGNVHAIALHGLPSVRRSRRGSHAALGFTVLVAISPMNATGAEWLTDASVDIASFHDDNVQLVTTPHESSSGYVFAPRVALKRNTETSKLDVRGHVAHTDYTRGAIPDKNEGALYLTSHKQLSERTTLGLDGHGRRDVLFQRVDFGPGVGDLRDTDIGLSSSTEVKRTYRTLQPYYNRLLSENSALRLSYRLTDVSFSEPVDTGLLDYKDHYATARYTRRLSEPDSFHVIVNAARHRPETDFDSKTLQLLVGMARDFAETTKGSFAVGVSETTRDSGGQSDRASGVVLRAGFEQRTELSVFDGVISRDVAPSGVGRTLESDQVRIRWVRKISPTMDFALRAQLLRNQELDGDAAEFERRYQDVQPELRWRWLENLMVSGSYRYRKQKFAADPDAADSNAIFLGLTYTL